MLSRASRLHHRADFQQATRRGRRITAPGLVLHAFVETSDPSRRVGFIVGRPVGPAVTRNQVRRRLRHLIAQRVSGLPEGARLVVRATPAAAGRPSAMLGGALDAALAKAYPGGDRR